MDLLRREGLRPGVRTVSCAPPCESLLLQVSERARIGSLTMRPRPASRRGLPGVLDGSSKPVWAFESAGQAELKAADSPSVDKGGIVTADAAVTIPCGGRRKIGFLSGRR